MMDSSLVPLFNSSCRRDPDRFAGLLLPGPLLRFHPERDPSWIERMALKIAVKLPIIPKLPIVPNSSSNDK